MIEVDYEAFAKKRTWRNLRYNLWVCLEGLRNSMTDLNQVIRCSAEICTLWVPNKYPFLPAILLGVRGVSFWRIMLRTAFVFSGNGLDLYLGGSRDWIPGSVIDSLFPFVYQANSVGSMRTQCRTRHRLSLQIFMFFLTTPRQVLIYYPRVGNNHFYLLIVYYSLSSFPFNNKQGDSNMMS